MITGGDCVTGHDPATGKELWRANGLNPDNSPMYRIVASPIIFDEIIYAPTRVKPLLALKAGGRGDITSSHVLWSTVNGPDVPTPVTDGKYFYVVNDRGIMWCSMPRLVLRSTRNNASSRAVTAARRCLPMERFTSRMRKA